MHYDNLYQSGCKPHHHIAFQIVSLKFCYACFICIGFRQCIWADFCGFIPQELEERYSTRQKHYIVEENGNVELQ